MTYKKTKKNKSNIINNLDLKITKHIYNIFNKPFLKPIPHYLGLIPYEFYVIPGMYIAILQVIWFGTPNPIQFHLLPHWFSYSIFQFMKGKINRPRPGCFDKSMSKYIDKGHCTHGHEYQSFPSGHTGVSVALATALFMEMMFAEYPHFFEISITSYKIRLLIGLLGLFISLIVGLHRISKGYHSFMDVICGAIIGFTIGFISWNVLEYFKKLYFKVCEQQNNKEDATDYCENYNYNNTGKGDFFILV